jgi:hypothetical protein
MNDLPLNPQSVGSAEPRRARVALDALNFLLADVRTGLGPCLAISIPNAAE